MVRLDSKQFSEHGFMIYCGCETSCLKPVIVVALLSVVVYIGVIIIRVATCVILGEFLTLIHQPWQVPNPNSSALASS